MNVDNIYYVYIWYITDTNEVFYVGKGKGDRYKQISGRNKFFTDMYNSHNCNVKKIYENLTEKEAFDKEVETIKWYKENTNYRLTNQTDGGEGTSGWVPSQEFKDKQSKIHSEQWQDEKFREKMLSIRQDENGVYKSKEFRSKISKLVQGENNPNYNHKWTDEMKAHLSQYRKENNQYKDEDNPNSKKVICIETGEVFECIKYAIDKYDIKEHSNFSAALRDPMRTAGGVHWAVYCEALLNEEFRTQYLIDVLLMDRRKVPMICLETKQIFKNANSITKETGITEGSIRWQLQTRGKITYDSKTYMKLRDYVEQKHIDLNNSIDNYEIV